jgi:hypothetical protein
VDPSIIAGLIGATATLAAVIAGWYGSVKTDRNQRRKDRKSLASTLAVEIMTLSNDVLNCVIEQDVSIEHSDFEKIVPPRSWLYRAVAHKLSTLGPSAATAVVRFYSDLDKVLRRTRRVCNLDYRKYKKSVRMEALERTVKEWNFVLLAAARVLRELEVIAGKSLDGIALEAESHCRMRRGPHKSRWRLPGRRINPRPSREREG